MTITRLRPTYTFDEDRLAQLRTVVPEAFADGKIDWDTLRDLLGDTVEDPAVEHFGLSWPGKREARRLASQPSRGALIPAPGEGVNEDTTRNIFIEGENLEVLKLLLKSYAGRVKMIYIDPPYNTGNDFIYSDKFSEAEEAHLRRTGQMDESGALVSNPKSGGRYHSNWLDMMYPRLLLARKLLRPDGAIFTSIDDSEFHNLRQILDEIFGPENFVNTVIWQKVFSPKNTARHFSEDHDYIVVYAQDADSWRPNLLVRSDEALARYRNLDNDQRGPWMSSDLSARNYYSLGQYEVTGPSGKIYTPPIGRYWTVPIETFRELDRDNRIWWGIHGSNMPRLKRFLSEVQSGVVPQTLWAFEEVGHTQEAKQVLNEYVPLQNTENVLNSVKPPRLIERMLHLATTTETDDNIVLDFFAGSGTTAHAVFLRNINDGGNRRFIAVQYPERLPIAEPQLKTIADLAKTRLRNVIAKLKHKQELQPDLFPVSPCSDLGFRVYRLDRSHFKPWTDYNGDDVAALQAQFEAFESPLVDEWKPDDLLVEIMLIEGFPLDSAVTRQAQFTANDVRLVESDFHEHRLWVCLDQRIQPATIQALDLADNDVFICLDSALDDETKLGLSDRGNLKTI